jgi:hypothetical protein
LSKSRQPMAMIMAISFFACPFDYVETLICCIGTRQAQSHEVQSRVALFVLHFIFCFVKVSKWWGVTRSWQPHVLTYMFCPYVISTPLPVTWRVTNVNFQKDTFLMHSSHNFTPKRNELGYHCCLSQLYFIWH